MDNAYQWIPFYEALADKLLEYRDKRSELFELIKKAASEQPLMEYLHFDREDWWGPRHHQIDPFIVIGVMNRGTTTYANRTILAKIIADVFSIDIPAPTQFAGVPVLNAQNSFFAGVDEVWDLFISAMKTAETGDFTDDFKEAFEKAIAVSGNGLAYITFGLYWIRPNVFMTLDRNSCSYIASKYDISAPSSKKCTGKEYVSFLETLKSKISETTPEISFPEISHTAWGQKNDDPANGSNITKTLAASVSPEKNILLYGAPGTGKTYSTVQYAVSIIEEKSLESIKAENYDAVFARYSKYKDDGLVAFTTFHQSFGYEEFIEGIRPVVASEEKAEAAREIEYEVHDGIFKAFCDKAGAPVGSGAGVDLGFGKNPTVWKVSLAGTGDNPIRTECMENNHIRIGWDRYGKTISDSTDYSNHGGSTVLNAFYNRMQIGDIVFSCYSSKTIDAIGVVTGEPEWYDDKFPEYKRLRGVKWLAKDLNEDIIGLNSGKSMTLSTIYKLSISVSDVMDTLLKVKPALFTQKVKIPNRVFIIDEINRGNISKIFGELITLIEPSKRIGEKEQQRAILPYSGQNFGVPNNVYIIGTMNTADRSIALIDTALRRRFSFTEMAPESSVLANVFVDNVDVAGMLDTINKRITVLLDREHTIGHSYLLPLRNDPSLSKLAEIFERKIIPLLQEYFYDDYEKIQLVLGDNQKPDDSTRFIILKNDAVKLFGNAGIDFSGYYEINSEAFNRIDAYAFLW